MQIHLLKSKIHRAQVTAASLEYEGSLTIAADLMERVGYAYACEFFIAWYSGNENEQFVFINRATGPFAWAYWTMITCNVISPQLFWFKKIRTSIPAMFVISLVINIGMWFERFVIIVTSLHRDFLPSSWGYYHPTLIDMCTYAGTFGLFFTAFLLFLRWVPMIAIAEVKGVLPEASPHADGHHTTDTDDEDHDAASDAALVPGE